MLLGITGTMAVLGGLLVYTMVHKVGSEDPQGSLR